MTPAKLTRSRLRTFLPACLAVVLACALLPPGLVHSQQLTLEGQTGGFITPTAYVVPAGNGALFSRPAIGYHFVNSNKVIGDIHTFSLTEGFANRAEAGYTRTVHVTGDSELFSGLWHESGMNIFHGKVVVLKETAAIPWAPAFAVGGVVRTGDRFVSGALYQQFTGMAKSYTNGDIYGVVTKSRFRPPVPFLLNFGLKFTNASIFGIGGQATRFGGRLFGGIGIPFPGPWKTAIVPAAGFSQQPPQVENLGAVLIDGRAHIPTTMDYAVRVTQKENARFAFDIGVGQVAGTIGTTLVITPAGPMLVPVDLEARSVLGLGLNYRF